MLRSLWIKFLILLFVVSVIALSSALFLREMMIRDFTEYLEGEMEDRVYWVTTDIEGSYEKYSGWKEDKLIEDAIWALMLGLEIRIKDVNGRTVMDTGKAIASLSPLMKRRVMAISDFRETGRSDPFLPYPLFLGGKEIGQVEVRFLRPKKETVFIKRSNRFLLFSFLAMGGLAILLSIVFSKRLTDPIGRLSAAARAISEGDLKSRVEVSGSDEISRLSEAFNRMAQNLEVQESLRKRLISNIAHELRTPVGAVRGELEGMIDGVIPADREGLKSLYEEVGRLKKIIEGLEELAQAQAAVLTLRRQSLELGPFLKNILDRFSRAFNDKGISAELQCDGGVRINADPDRLSQIIINLLDNALKATGPGGRVWVRAGIKGSGRYIEVGDTGCGIKEEDLPYIFERFYRASEGGLGLGLAIVKELVEAHGGRVEVRSEYGKGTVFTVYIPAW